MRGVGPVAQLVRAGDSSIMVPSQRKLRSGRDEFRETSELLADGNPEPSRRYTAGRCRDYLSAGVALNNRLERPAPTILRGAAGEEIVHSHRKRRGRVNPLVLGSSPSGPTNSQQGDCIMTQTYSGGCQ